MQLRPESLAVASGRPDRTPRAPVNPPLALSSTFHSAPDANHYLRNSGGEPMASFEAAAGTLEGGRALAFGSGMAAIAAVVETLPVGTVAVIPASGYSGMTELFREEEAAGRLAVRRVDTGDTDAVLAALPGANLLWLETVTNPLIAVPDLPVLIEAAHAQGGLAVVDATFSTPLLARPLDLGADVVMHSATKLYSGHADLLMGVLVTRDDARYEALFRRRVLTGALPGALEAFLALRGLRTLAVRLERAQANAAELAGRLAGHPRVERVRYPGLPDDPFHERAARLFRGFGTMLSFDVAGDAEAVCQRVRLVAHATSLGGVESLIERRARHPFEAANDTPPNLLRLSVGIEHVEDLWADLEHALAGQD